MAFALAEAPKWQGGEPEYPSDPASWVRFVPLQVTEWYLDNTFKSENLQHNWFLL